MPAQDRSQRRAQVSARREKLYGEFIEEASRLFADALTHELSDVTKLVQLHSIINRMRLFAPADVVANAEEAMKQIMETYYRPNADFRSLEKAREEHFDTLQSFSDRCRADLSWNV